ncbi:hypothetical protein LAZ67_1003173 [Cordylochernes scorpioides]|uniref:Uncharacterized protein n=1 Tax=Cordylochernes scorpioides TaxID=51811 RepID=A0ABY6JWQ5_9ARAC|nr:hypothetical protein LAZ67_1003173 [Cordylochernes scorpioides]
METENKPSDTSEICKVSVKIPPFWVEKPEIWFFQGRDAHPSLTLEDRGVERRLCVFVLASGCHWLIASEAVSWPSAHGWLARGARVLKLLGLRSPRLFTCIRWWGWNFARIGDHWNIFNQKKSSQCGIRSRVVAVEINGLNHPSTDPLSKNVSCGGSWSLEVVGQAVFLFLLICGYLTRGITVFWIFQKFCLCLPYRGLQGWPGTYSPDLLDGVWSLQMPSGLSLGTLSRQQGPCLGRWTLKHRSARSSRQSILFFLLGLLQYGAHPPDYRQSLVHVAMINMVPVGVGLSSDHLQLPTVVGSIMELYARFVYHI